MLRICATMARCWCFRSLQTVGLLRWSGKGGGVTFCLILLENDTTLLYCPMEKFTWPQQTQRNLNHPFINDSLGHRDVFTYSVTGISVLTEEERLVVAVYQNVIIFTKQIIVCLKWGAGVTMMRVECLRKTILFISRVEGFTRRYIGTVAQRQCWVHMDFSGRM